MWRETRICIENDTPDWEMRIEWTSSSDGTRNHTDWYINHRTHHFHAEGSAPTVELAKSAASSAASYFGRIIATCGAEDGEDCGTEDGED